MLLKRLFRPILNFVLPKRCIMCGTFTQTIPHSSEPLGQPSLCTECWQNVSFITDPTCKRCSAPLTFDGDECASCYGIEFHFDAAYAPITYNDAAKRLITQFKHSGRSGYTQLFSPWMKSTIELQNNSYDGIVPVPLHFWRFVKRGYNQATLLAHGIALYNKETHEPIPVLKGALKRIRHTPSQGHKSAGDRAKNIKNSLIANRHIVAGKNLLLIDDVMTTGATLNECARILKEAGAIHVDVLVLARATKTI
ncbi:MAG: ComF family protein [Candidatus Paracaedibacteraceae bacterium]|nr:ComF family protein [Candidatus Paracaedibacteraceae bacterium]